MQLFEFKKVLRTLDMTIKKRIDMGKDSPYNESVQVSKN